MAASGHNEAAERLPGLIGRWRARIVGVLRAVPIRWRILSIAALNSAVVIVLVAMIWNGAQVLGSRLGFFGKFSKTVERWMPRQVVRGLPRAFNHVHDLAGGSSQLSRTFLQR